VSDFITPSYYDPVANPAGRYSFTGAITAPRQVLVGGYLSWHDPTTEHWWQVVYNGPEPTYRDLGAPTTAHENLRHFIDSQTPFANLAPELAGGLSADSGAMARLVETARPMADSTASKAASWRAQIAALKRRRP
jgi:hypothetical protein